MNGCLFSVRSRLLATGRSVHSHKVRAIQEEDNAPSTSPDVAAASRPIVPMSARQMRAGTVPSGAWSTAAPGSAQGSRPPAMAPGMRRRLVPTGEPTLDLALSLALVGDDIKGQDVMILNVEKLISWASMFVIVSCINRPQMQAMMYRMEKEAREKHGLTLKQNPNSKAEWEVLDFGSVVVHVMSPQARLYYGIEEFYAAAEEVLLEDHITMV